MENKENTVRKICQLCANYSRCSKKCSETGNFVARKKECDCGKFAKK